MFSGYTYIGTSTPVRFWARRWNSCACRRRLAGDAASSANESTDATRPISRGNSSDERRRMDANAGRDTDRVSVRPDHLPTPRLTAVCEQVAQEVHPRRLGMLCDRMLIQPAAHRLPVLPIPLVQRLQLSLLIRRHARMQ